MHPQRVSSSLRGGQYQGSRRPAFSTDCSHAAGGLFLLPCHYCGMHLAFFFSMAGSIIERVLCELQVAQLLEALATSSATQWEALAKSLGAKESDIWSA